VKRTISARADGAVCLGREAVPVGVDSKLNWAFTLLKQIGSGEA